MNTATNETRQDRQRLRRSARRLAGSDIATNTYSSVCQQDGVAAMNIKRPLALRMIALWAIVLALLPAAAFAGLPNPGFVLYGKVYDDAGAEIYEGDLVWTFTPKAGGDPVTLHTRLEPIPGLGGPYAYKIIVPFEIELPDSPAGPGAIPLPTTAVEYIRSGSVTGSAVTMLHDITLSDQSVSAVTRVDVCLGCKAETLLKHSADYSGDYRFSLSELLRTFELHSATPSHAYHINPDTRDGFDIGPGSQSGVPHTGDFDGGADWTISGREVVRMIDLFTSTPDHAYTIDPTTPDGFKKADGGALGAKAVEVGGYEEAPGLKLRRTISGGAPGATRGALQVALEIQGSENDTVSGLGISETLPEGWVYSGTVGDGPAVQPAAGASGTLDFVWFPVPATPFNFEYTISIASGMDTATAFSALQDAGYYRKATKEAEYAMPVSAHVSTEGTFDVDTDGDGIADTIDGTGDADNDGIPNFLDSDSDNDGLSDQQEANLDGSPVYSPYNPVSNPTGTDSDINNADTNNNGFSDSLDVEQGNSPLPAGTPSAPKAVPALDGFGMAFLLLCLGGLGIRIHGRKRAA